MLELFPIFIGIILAQIAPGPNLMAVSSFAVKNSRKAGVLVASGVALGMFIWAILFSFGMAAFLSAFPQALTYIKLIGGSYLLYMAFMAIKSSLKPSINFAKATPSQTTNKQAFLTGLLVVLTNPKTALLWVAIATFLTGFHLSSIQFLVFGLAVSLSAFCVYGSYAYLFSTGLAVRGYNKFFKIIEAAFGTIFGALGAKLILDGLAEIKK